MSGFLKHKKALLAVIIVLNALPVLGSSLSLLSSQQTAYFYWAEGGLLVLFTLFMYMKHLIVFFALAGLTAVMLGLPTGLSGNDIKVLLTFWGPYCLFWLSYIEVGKSRYWEQVRRLHPYEQFFIYLLFTAIAITTCFLLTVMVFNGWSLLKELPFSFYLSFFGTALGIPTIAIGALKIIDMIGSRHFLDFLMGTYYRPVEQERIVMFLDMVGSSGMAEQMDPKRSMHLIARFIFDAGSVIRQHGGDILNFTGDGLVVLWPRGAAAQALTAVTDLRKRIQASQSSYRREFGAVPDFRIGLHAGRVVISQIGEEKLFLGLHGDVVNTAARLEQMNKELGTKVLLSSAVVRGINQSWQAFLRPMGVHEIRGRKEPVEIFTLYDELKS